MFKSPKSVAFPVVAMVTCSKTFPLLAEVVLTTPFTLLPVAVDPLDDPYVSISPKSCELPKVVNVKNSITFLTAVGDDDPLKIIPLVCDAAPP